MSASDIARFWSKVDVRSPDECWSWLGGVTGNGYGAIKLAGRQVGAHRVAHEFANGPIPEGHETLHSCDNPLCCNPYHLSHGTRKDNSDDKREKGRANYTGRPPLEVCKRGHPRTPENLRGYSCRICMRDYQREWKRRH